MVSFCLTNLDHGKTLEETRGIARLSLNHRVGKGGTSHFSLVLYYFLPLFLNFLPQLGPLGGRARKTLATPLEETGQCTGGYSQQNCNSYTFKVHYDKHQMLWVLSLQKWLSLKMCYINVYSAGWHDSSLMALVCALKPKSTFHSVGLILKLYVWKSNPVTDTWNVTHWCSLCQRLGCGLDCGQGGSKCMSSTKCEDRTFVCALKPISMLTA